jgi:4-hydroxy-tetrahydrodipicolinate synthase
MTKDMTKDIQKLRGSLVAIVTPMNDDGSLDLASYKKLIDWHIDSGTAAIVAVGTTGESPTVDVDEHIELIKVAVEQAAGRVPIIAGTGANSTKEAIWLTQQAKAVGASSTLQVAPYYNRPGQEGLYQHFKAVALEGGLPVILYNVPGRTVVDISNDTVLRLAALPQVIGLKDATGDIPRATDLLARLAKIRPDFAVYSGNDDVGLALALMGGDGVISVTANVAPAQLATMYKLAFEGQGAKAVAINTKLLPLHFKLFVEANPIPVKYALAKMKMMGPAIRLPLTQLASANCAIVDAALLEAGVL